MGDPAMSGGCCLARAAPGLDAQGAGAGLLPWLPWGTPSSAVYKTPTEKRVRTRRGDHLHPNQNLGGKVSSTEDDGERAEEGGLFKG